MKTLFLLRHAKSSWKDESLPDFERPLNRRGKETSERIGRYVKSELIVPDLVLSSPAIRARETIGLVAKFAKWTTELRFDERIYGAGAIGLLEVVAQIENERKTALLVGHNPGMEELLLLLTGSIEQLPTGALAKVEIKATKWSAAVDKKAKLAWVVRPRELPDD